MHYMDYFIATTEKNEFTTIVINVNRDFEHNPAKNLKKKPKGLQVEAQK